MFGDWPSGDVGGLTLTLVIGILAIVGCTLLGTIVGYAHRYAAIACRPLYVQTMRNIPANPCVLGVFSPAVPHFELSKFSSVLIALTAATAASSRRLSVGGILSVRTEPRARERWFKCDLYLALGHSPQAFFNMIRLSRDVTSQSSRTLSRVLDWPLQTAEIGRQINNFLMSSPIEVYFTLLVIYFIVNRGISMLMRLLEDLSRFNRLFLRL
jgi:polar amino acid transport system permease protein